jgi:hypothetical protein
VLIHCWCRRHLLRLVEGVRRSERWLVRGPGILYIKVAEGRLCSLSFLTRPPLRCVSHTGGVGESTVRTAADFNNPMSLRYVVSNNLQKTQAIFITVRIATRTKTPAASYWIPSSAARTMTSQLADSRLDRARA